MPTYNFICDNCNQNIELFCSIKEYDKYTKNIACSNCSSKNIHRNYEEDNVYSTVKEIKTIGQLAEANTKKMGSKLTEEYEKNKKEEPKKPWYQDSKFGSANRKEINKMTNEQKKKYILNGKK